MLLSPIDVSLSLKSNEKMTSGEDFLKNHSKQSGNRDIFTFPARAPGSPGCEAMLAALGGGVVPFLSLP